MLRNVLSRVAALPTVPKVLLAIAALVLLGLAVLLSPLLTVLALLVLSVAVVALLIQLLRRASLRRWGIVAAVSLVLVLLFSGISNALYFRGAQEQAIRRSSKPGCSLPVVDLPMIVELSLVY